MGKQGIKISSVDVEELLKMLNAHFLKSGLHITNIGLEQD